MNEEKPVDQEKEPEKQQVNVMKIPKHILVFNDFYKLKGRYNDQNNYDDFKWWIATQWISVGLWQANGPTSSVTVGMILLNIDETLHAHYRKYRTAMDLYLALETNYSNESQTTKAILLSQLVTKKYDVDIDKSLLDYEKQVRNMLSTFGETMDTQMVCQILFLQKHTVRLELLLLLHQSLNLQFSVIH